MYGLNDWKRRWLASAFACFAEVHKLGIHIANETMKCNQDLNVVSRISRNHKQELKLLFGVYNTAAMHCEFGPFHCVAKYHFVEQITQVYHLDMSLPKILVVNQFTTT